MSWFGEPHAQPILSNDMTDKEKGAGDALAKEGYDTFKVDSVWCGTCGGEDGSHIPGARCEGVN